MIDPKDYNEKILIFDQYSKVVDKMFEEKHPDELKRIMVTMLHTIGLCGEVGEYAEKVKKSIRDRMEIQIQDPKIKKELGDVHWYLGSVERDYRFSIEDVMEENVTKLQKRLEENKIHGEGDER